VWVIDWSKSSSVVRHMVIIEMRRHMSRIQLTASVFALLFGGIACTETTALPKAATIDVNSVADQTGFLGAFVAENPEVLVRDAGGQPVAGVTVKFSVTAGGGSVSNATTVSGPQGRATAGAWTLGPLAGVNTVVGTVDGVGSVQFKADAVPVPTGTFRLATIDGFHIPFAYAYPFSSDSIVAGTFTLTSARVYTFVVQADTSDGLLNQRETSGGFAPKLPKGLTFYLNGFPWIDGTLDGDTLTVGVWDDFMDALHSYVFVRETSS
jgi:hypothetical protein